MEEAIKSKKEAGREQYIKRDRIWTKFGDEYASVFFLLYSYPRNVTRVNDKHTKLRKRRRKVAPPQERFCQKEIFLSILFPELAAMSPTKRKKFFFRSRTGKQSEKPHKTPNYR